MTHTIPGPSGPRDLVLRTSHGATGGAVWDSSNVLGALLVPLLQQPDQVVLEMGSGTGFMAMMLASAAAKGTRIIATDVRDQMRDLKYNVSRNQLRHAVCSRTHSHHLRRAIQHSARAYVACHPAQRVTRLLLAGTLACDHHRQVSCLCWEWSEPPPSELEWGKITLCVAADVVYYSESAEQEAALVAGLRAVLGRCRADARVLLLLRLRLNALEGGSASRSELLVPVEADEACASATLRFVTHALPRAGLSATELPIPDALTRDGSFRYFEVAVASPEDAALIVQEAVAAATAGGRSVELASTRGPTDDIAAEVLSTEQGDELWGAPLADLMAWGEST